MIKIIAEIDKSTKEVTLRLSNGGMLAMFTYQTAPKIEKTTPKTFLQSEYIVEYESGDNIVSFWCDEVEVKQ